MSESRDVRAELDALRGEVERLAAELTDLRAHASFLESLAQEDPLTGLLNRRGLFRELARAIAHRARYGTPIALLVADLDAFKGINDRHGHGAGDEALVHVAKLLRNNVRASDTVGRLGGDEFAVLLWHVGEEAASQKARSLEAMIAASPVRAGRFGPALGASIGAALLEGADTAEEALARADRAMYRRKAERRGGP
ncbi:MAG TPA: GGDEF domain-containing protein [Microvirga sp.]|nr:GGDEF domain-containing protein [Microvirga sp.]